jgi:hypothetical protein
VSWQICGPLRGGGPGGVPAVGGTTGTGVPGAGLPDGAVRGGTAGGRRAGRIPEPPGPVPDIEEAATPQDTRLRRAPRKRQRRALDRSGHGARQPFRACEEAPICGILDEELARATILDNPGPAHRLAIALRTDDHAG